MEHNDLPLQIGEVVRYDTHGAGAGASGVVVERLGEDYLRVFWKDMSVTTTHRCHSLRRVADSVTRASVTRP